MPVAARTHLGTYEELAAEYYDSQRHPTCANFREASVALIRQTIAADSSDLAFWCDVGCGDSVLAEIRAAQGRSLDRVILVDASLRMLSYSKHWQRRGARFINADVCSLPFENGSLRGIVASLGDPYNAPRFWQEVARTLEPQGTVVFTTPSWPWAKAFRGTVDEPHVSCAEFVLQAGQTVCVPSYIFPPVEQRSLMASVGLTLTAVTHTTINDLRSRYVSGKLLVGSLDLPIVSCFTAVKAR